MINTKDPPVPLAAATFADCRDLESTKDGESVKMGRVWIDSVSIKSTRCPVRSQVKRGGAGGEHWGIPGTCRWRRDAARSNHARCARTVIWRNLKSSTAHAALRPQLAAESQMPSARLLAQIWGEPLEMARPGAPREQKRHTSHGPDTSFEWRT